MARRVLALVALACLAAPAQADEKAVVEKILNLGGMVTRDEKQEGKPVVAVDLRSAELTGGLLKQLAEFKQLRALILWDTPVDDALVGELASLTGLQTLELDGTEISGDGLKKLAPLKALRRLSLWRVRVGDAGLKTLAKFADLEELNLGNTRITDSGLKELVGLKKLRG